MQQADMLELLAELAVAFAGFTGLVGAFRANRDDDEAFRSELRLLIEFSLYLMLSSLVPLFLWQVGLPEAMAWRLASLGSVAYVAIYYVRRFGLLFENASKYGNTRVLVGTLVIETPLAALLLANGFGILPWDPHVAYVANLFYQLVGTSLSFMRFAAPLWREPSIEHEVTLIGPQPP
jgi:hypothetical protein